jgi:uncharacterized repeat protein (TIGR03803 family)
MKRLLLLFCLFFVARALAVTPVYTPLYNFLGAQDGAQPTSGVIADAAGNLYGTTASGGGATAAICGTGGCGTVFEVSPNADGSYSESILYRFQGGKDGGIPAGLVRDPAGNLYGTTNLGGSFACGPVYGCGTVFKVSSSGQFSVLHTFSGRDGYYPEGILVLVGKTLYGVTDGSTGGNGTIFKLTVTGRLTTLYTFTDGLDGGNPTGRLTVDHAGNLYGTTSIGGGGSDCGGLGCGTLFRFNYLTGVFTTLVSMSQNGEINTGLAIDAQGNLYGSSGLGGTYNDGQALKFDSQMSESTLYSFGAKPHSPNATGPTCGVVKVGNYLYGPAGGGFNHNGTIWRVNTVSGTAQTLHEFAGSSQGGDGAGPTGDLLWVGGVFYGVTVGGGTARWGVVYRVVLQ